MVRDQDGTRAARPAGASGRSDGPPAVRVRGGAGAALGLMVAVVLVWAATVTLVLRPAALGDEAAGTLFVAFPPGTSEPSAFAAILGAGGTPVRLVLGGWGWVAHDDEAGFVGRLEANGALIAFREPPGGFSLAGCFAFVDRQEPRLDPLTRALDARLGR